MRNLLLSSLFLLIVSCSSPPPVPSTAVTKLYEQLILLQDNSARVSSRQWQQLSDEFGKVGEFEGLWQSQLALCQAELKSINQDAANQNCLTALKTAQTIDSSEGIFQTASQLYQLSSNDDYLVLAASHAASQAHQLRIKLFEQGYLLAEELAGMNLTDADKAIAYYYSGKHYADTAMIDTAIELFKRDGLASNLVDAYFAKATILHTKQLTNDAEKNARIALQVAQSAGFLKRANFIKDWLDAKYLVR